LKTDIKGEAGIGKVEFVTPPFSEVEIDTLPESASQSEVESRNSSIEISRDIRWNRIGESKYICHS